LTENTTPVADGGDVDEALSGGWTVQVKAPVLRRGQVHGNTFLVNGTAHHGDAINLSSTEARDTWIDDALTMGMASGIPDAPTRERLAAALVRAWERATSVALPSSRPAQKAESQATELIGFAEQCELSHNGETSYARVQIAGHLENWKVRSRSFKEYLRGLYLDAHRKAVGAQAVQDAVETISGLAQRCEQRPVYTRLAWHDDAAYLDLCNESWQVIRIDGTGWRVQDESPVMFRRSPAMLPLPLPQAGGNIGMLRPFVNLLDDDWVLYKGWLVAALRPTGPHTVLGLHGEHGSAKSTAARITRALIDPNVAPIRGEPREARDLVLAGENGHIIAIDNLSGLERWLSDLLCCIATGAGFSARRYYTDDEETIYSICKPIIVNGINEVATRPDLLDRSMLLSLPAFKPGQRKPERALWTDFERQRPKILGALLDAVVQALARVDRVPEPDVRMSDFAQWVIAAEPALAMRTGQFMQTYTGNRAEANALALESSVIGEPILRLVGTQKHPHWCGTPTELMDALTKQMGEDFRPSREWPRDATRLSKALKRITTNLAAEGITVARDRGGKLGARWVALTNTHKTDTDFYCQQCQQRQPTGKNGDKTPNPVDASEVPADATDATDARLTLAREPTERAFSAPTLGRDVHADAADATDARKQTHSHVGAVVAECPRCGSDDGTLSRDGRCWHCHRCKQASFLHGGQLP